MLLNHLKAYVYGELKNKLIIVIALITMLSIINALNNSLENEQKNIEINSKSTTKKLASLKNEIVSTQKAQKLWEEGVSEKFQERTGMKVKELNKILEQLKESYKLKNLIVNLTNPERKKENINLEFSKIMYSVGNISFESLTDIDVFKFIETFHKEIPGFIQIKSLETIRNKGKIENALKEIESGKIAGLINYRMEFIWLDVEDINSSIKAEKKSLVPSKDGSKLKTSPEDKL